MSRRSAAEMLTPRMGKAAPPVLPTGTRVVRGSASSPNGEPGETAAQEQADTPKNTIAVPKGGEVRIRSLKGGGILASSMDSGYNTVEEAYAEDPSSLQLVGTSGR